MKKRIFIIPLVVLILLTSCYGNFSLTRKVYQFNGSVGDDIAQTAVFWAFCIIPVYSVSAFLDAVVFNTIEYWTGSNPIAMKAGEYETRLVKSEKGTFQITATQNRFDIVKIDGDNAGEEISLVFNTDDNSWSMEKENDVITFAKFSEDTLDLIYPDGAVETIKLR